MKLKGSVTVFLSLLISLFLILVQTLSYGLTIQNGKNYRKADTMRAVECIFAEYQKALWERYGILGIEGSYERGDIRTEKQIKDNLEKRISFYDEGMLSHEILAVTLLSDGHGEELGNQIFKIMEPVCGSSVVEESKNKEKVLKRTEEQKAGVKNELDSIKRNFETMQGKETEEGENPLKKLASLFSKGILGIVFPKDQSLSSKKISLESLPSKRELVCGQQIFRGTKDSLGLLEKAYAGAYIKEHFTHTLSGKAGTGGFQYEMEYLLQGEESDEANLEGTVAELVLLRFFPDYLYIQQDEMKKAEAKTAAAAICLVLALPEMTEIVTQILLAVWSYSEAVLDVKTLLEGGKVPFQKTAQTWKLALSGIWNIGACETANAGEGWNYEEYLQVLLLREEKETLYMRMLDLMELNLKTDMGKNFFKVDACVCAVQVKSTGVLPGEITYRFQTKYRYE